MSYDGKILARARGELDRIREQNQAEHAARQARIYREIPAIQELDRTMRTQMTDLVRLTLSHEPDLKERLDALREKNLDAQVARAELLTAHGYPVEYLDDLYSCPRCRDTGNVNGAVCDCLQKLYNRELTQTLSSLLRNGDESFENFDLTLYPDERGTAENSPRDTMKAVFAGCKKFAYNFPAVSANLLLQGGTGLGKTYLSACIARVVSEKGYSVCYDTAAAALEAFERQKFSRDPEEAEEAGTRVKRMLSCDLMILDDLGTEMVTAMTQSALYTLLNTRLNAGKRLILSTNYTAEERAARYTPQICSRIDGEFLLLPFVGNDIRRTRAMGNSQ